MIAPLAFLTHIKLKWKKGGGINGRHTAATDDGGRITHISSYAFGTTTKNDKARTVGTYSSREWAIVGLAGGSDGVGGLVKTLFIRLGRHVHHPPL